MNAAQIHLAINHIPVLGVIGGFLLLLLARWRKSADIELAALIVLIVAAAFAVPTYLSGSGAEEVVEHLPGVTEDYIEPHEDIGRIALIGALILGAIAAFALWQTRGRKPLSKRLSATVLGLALVISGLMGYTALLGGEVHHTELRSGFDASPAGDEDAEANPEADPEAGEAETSSGDD